jgi:hypothetical protein
LNRGSLAGFAASVLADAVVKSITQSELEALFFATDKTQFVSFVSVTDPSMRKRENPYSKARKVSLVVGVVNWTYSKTVNRQRGREQKVMNFRALERKWGTRVKGTPLVSHVVADQGETRLYLEVKVERRTFLYFDSETRERIDEAAIEPFLKDPDPNPRQDLDREIVLRDYRLISIAELTLGGEQYRIAPAADELLTYIPAPKPEAARSGWSPDRAKKRTYQRRKPDASKRSKRGAL